MTAGRSRALPITAALLGFAVAMTWTEGRATQRAVGSRRAGLARVITARQAQTARLEARLASLRARLKRTTSGGERLGPLRRELDRIGLLAGRAGVSGPGLVVELADSPLAKAGDREATDYRIQDLDLQLAVNALWAAGAEAIAVNGQRVVSTTAIRSAGGAVLVNYRVLTSPFRVVAIGNAGSLDAAFSHSTIATRFRRWAEIYGLGFQVKRERRIRVPAYGGGLRFRYAAPASER